MIWILNLKQLLHTILRHLLDVFLVSLKELEEDADHFCFHFDDIEI